MKPHNIQVRDQVLLDRKQTKLHSPYDPRPYDVSQVHGTQIVARRGEEQKTRDAQHWKKVNTSPRLDYTEIRQKLARRRDQDYYPDIGAPREQSRPVTSQATQPGRPDTPGVPAFRTPARHPPREAWSFHPPQVWPRKVTRTVTRSVSARRMAERERVMKDTRGRTARSTDNGVEGSRDNATS